MGRQGCWDKMTQLCWVFIRKAGLFSGSLPRRPLIDFSLPGTRTLPACLRAVAFGSRGVEKCRVTLHALRRASWGQDATSDWGLIAVRHHHEQSTRSHQPREEWACLIAHRRQGCIESQFARFLIRMENEPSGTDDLSDVGDFALWVLVEEPAPHKLA